MDDLIHPAEGATRREAIEGFAEDLQAIIDAVTEKHDDECRVVGCLFELIAAAAEHDPLIEAAFAFVCDDEPTGNEERPPLGA